MHWDGIGKVALEFAGGRESGKTTPVHPTEIQTSNSPVLDRLPLHESSASVNNATEQLVDDDGSVETALINYLFAKQVVNRLRSQMDVSDLQRKRSYWKQCAFNAVSCFGKFRGTEMEDPRHRVGFQLRSFAITRDLPNHVIDTSSRSSTEVHTQIRLVLI
uniref:Prohormone-1 n=1 Tax=Timema monikensis TaxID=170555 RepID=A0A7R9E419_9NEOP|nr:unnamed protein product [Timema monikensis]